MIKYKRYYIALAFILLATSTKAAENSNQATLQKIIDKLDLNSFNNSIGPRREKGKVTFKDYGASEVKFDAEKAIVSEPDHSWQFIITLLNRKNAETKICFEDQAMNGGTYHSQNAYWLKADKSGLLKASPAEDASCPEFAK